MPSQPTVLAIRRPPAATAHEPTVITAAAADTSSTSSRPLQTWTLALFPVLAGLGPYASFSSSGASSFYLYRALVLVSVIPALALLPKVAREGGTPAKLYRLLAVLWVLWAPLTLFWSPDLAGGGRAIVSTSFALFGGLCVLAIAQGTSSAVAVLRRGWTAAYVATALVSLWEVVTGSHLPSPSAAILAQSGLQYTHYAASTLGNPNDYSGFLLATAPILVHGAITGRSRRIRAFYIALIVSWCYLLPQTQSRTAFLGGLLTAVLVAVWMIWLRGSRLVVPLAGLGVFVIVLYVHGAFDSIFSNARFAFQTNTAASDSSRLALTKLGFHFFTDSAMFGHGAGAYSVLVQHATLQGATQVNGLTNAHDAFIEVAAEYGIVILLPLLALILSCVFLSRSRIDPALTRAQFVNFRMSMLLCSVALIGGGLVSSSTVRSPWWWMLIGYMAAYASVMGRTKTEEPADKSLPHRRPLTNSADPRGR